VIIVNVPNTLLGIGLRIQLIGGYFMMIKANEFVDALEKNLMEILGPYRHNSLEVRHQIIMTL
jgi:hypothetical protein